MKKSFIIILSYITIFFNSNVLSDEQNQLLKIGLLAPLSGEYRGLGNSLLYSLQMALEEIDDDDVIIIPRDSGLNNKEKLNAAIKDIRSQGARIIIGPINNEDFKEVKKYSDILFISPSNISPEFENNIISVGISLESQLTSIFKFIKKEKKNKIVILFPKNEYSDFIEAKLNKFDLKNMKTFQYSPDPRVLTGEIEELTNYSQREKFRTKKKCFRIKKMINLLKN